MKKMNWGFSLIELIIVTAMMGILALWISGILGDAISGKSSSQMLAKAKLTAESQSLLRRLRGFFNRSRAIRFTQVGAAVPNFLISQAGAIVLSTDTRDCNTFNPFNSSANLTSVGISCCSPTVPVPALTPGGTTLTLNSACGTSLGLTITEFDTAGGIIRSLCDKNIVEMNVSLAGYSTINYSSLYNIDLVGQTVMLPNGQPAVINPIYFNLITSLGNSITPAPSAASPLYSASPLVTCSNVGQFN
jgi:prepilin-type N-terminal cleavage/methylation domain-containing protein